MRTSLYNRHVERGAQMVEFGGWLMPLHYSSIREEHVAVRERAGIFDVSHMGEFRLRGENAQLTLESIVTNRIGDMDIGQARYSLVCNPEGGILDDALVYRQAVDDYLVVVNAGPRPRDLEHFQAHAGGSSPVLDETQETTLLAVQGPRAIDVLRPLSSADLDLIAYYHHREGQLAGIPCTFSRTGYTGEDGFELFLPWGAAEQAWDSILRAGRDIDLLPCGLGARDTLRLEAAMRLSGQDFDESANPFEAGLGWAVKLDKGDFVGREALCEVKARGPRRALLGLQPEGRAIARHGNQILDAGSKVGEITSGTFSFTLGRAIAMGYVDVDSRQSEQLAVEIRSAPVPARRVPLPFYQRPRS